MVISSDQCVSVVSLFINSSASCVHRCMTFTKPIQLFKSECDSAFYVSTLSTNEKSWHRAAAGGNRKSVRAIVFNPTFVSIYNLSMVWICIISANCRHRPLATDPGHVTCWDNTTASAHGCWCWQRIWWNWRCNVRGDYCVDCCPV